MAGSRFSGSSTDPMQMWAIGQTFTASAYEALVMTAAGWKIPAASSNVAANSVICSKTTPIYTLNSNTSKYYSFRMDKVTQTEAQLICKADGGYLAITYGEAARINVLHRFSGFYAWTRDFWVAGVYNSTTARWIFPNSEAPVYFLYSIYTKYDYYLHDMVWYHTNGSISDSADVSMTRNDTQALFNVSSTPDPSKSCLYSVGNPAGWLDGNCNSTRGILCERTFA